MKEQNLLTLFFIDSQGYENYGLALVPGEYQAQPEAEAEKAYLIISMCVDCDSIFAFYYVDFNGNYLGHSPLHSGEESIDYVLLEAWSRFDVLPHYWILAQEKRPSVMSEYSQSEYAQAYIRLREILSRFRWAENSKAIALNRSPASNEEKGYELNRLFYPDLPPEIFPPLTL